MTFAGADASLESLNEGRPGRATHHLRELAPETLAQDTQICPQRHDRSALAYSFVRALEALGVVP
jgi:hypothetical protein